ncbi:hypothetical protein [Alkalibacillus haloalkaliphilus]|uniref:hypothetical protein n=1 Tax=Alkalibacillus haloalkaliphilus TaxID=94136 RepID=UPI0029368573|nr:hypothetical protein [Alkalibacillus haloalkaliphilus]MDV2581769.1 hypothetical protein [Alkalibacillus haloalkaliphilus]
MEITFDRPFIATQKFLNIKQGNVTTGKMRRWVRPPRERPSSNPQYDVNIEVVGSTDYQITQQSFSVREGYYWELRQDNQIISSITSSKGLKEKHRVDYHFNESVLTIEADWSMKPEGKVLIDDREIGRTRGVGLLTNRHFSVEIDSRNHQFDPNLVAGIAYTFWCSNNRG